MPPGRSKGSGAQLEAAAMGPSQGFPSHTICESGQSPLALGGVGRWGGHFVPRG